MHLSTDKRRIMSGICGLIFICSVIYIGIYYVRQLRANQQYEELQETAVVPVVRNVQDEALEEHEPEPEEPQVDPSIQRENSINFEELWKSNPDIYAWIEVPGTLVNYPVLQHPTDDSYYLNHTVEGAEGLPGSIYTESVHSRDFTAVNTVLYGHNMKNDTMFGSLHEYEKQEFLDENPYVYIYLPDRTIVYQIFAASRFSNAYLPEYCDYEKEEGFVSYIDEIYKNAVSQDESVDVPFGSRLLTMSTCIANDAAHRFLVEAVYLGEYDR